VLLFVEEPKDMMNPNKSLKGTDMGQKISQVLTNCGFDSDIKGYKYLKDAIIFCLENEDVRITKVLYPMLAKKYGVSICSVERAIRYSIKRAFDKACPEFIELARYTTSSLTGRLSNGQCISLISERISEGLL